MGVRFIASKLTTVAASVAIFGGATAWLAARTTDRQPPPDSGAAFDAPAQPGLGTPPPRQYIVRRIAPDGSVYFQTTSAPPARPAPATRTRAS
jgi:hypothetical protein